MAEWIDFRRSLSKILLRALQVINDFVRVINDCLLQWQESLDDIE